jgi:hypothetical protein
MEIKTNQLTITFLECFLMGNVYFVRHGSRDCLFLFFLFFLVLFALVSNEQNKTNKERGRRAKKFNSYHLSSPIPRLLLLFHPHEVGEGW